MYNNPQLHIYNYKYKILCVKLLLQKIEKLKKLGKVFRKLTFKFSSYIFNYDIL